MEFELEWDEVEPAWVKMEPPEEEGEVEAVAWEALPTGVELKKDLHLAMAVARNWVAEAHFHHHWAWLGIPNFALMMRKCPNLLLAPQLLRFGSLQRKATSFGHKKRAPQAVFSKRNYEALKTTELLVMEF